MSLSVCKSVVLFLYMVFRGTVVIIRAHEVTVKSLLEAHALIEAHSPVPIGAVCTGSTLFASILNLSVMLGNFFCSRRLQQTTFSDEYFLGALRVKNLLNPFKGGFGIQSHEDECSDNEFLFITGQAHLINSLQTGDDDVAHQTSYWPITLYFRNILNKIGKNYLLYCINCPKLL